MVEVCKEVSGKRLMPLKIEVGQSYFNGFAARIQITKAPSPKSRWFEDDMENRYHEDGCYVGVGTLPEFNLRRDEP